MLVGLLQDVRTPRVNADPVEVAGQLLGHVGLSARGQSYHGDDTWRDGHVGNVRA